MPLSHFSPILLLLAHTQAQQPTNDNNIWLVGTMLLIAFVLVIVVVVLRRKRP